MRRSRGMPSRGTRASAVARALSGALVLVFASNACEPRTTAPAFTTLDSAGITIAISMTPAWDVEPASRWSLSPEPVLDLAATGAGPLHEFFGVAGATVQDDGRIVVAGAGSNQVRSFSSSGASLGVVGREGEGPEDYNGIGLLQRMPGDSLAVFSWPTRLTILDPDLTFVRTHRLADLVRDPKMLAAGDLVAMRIYASVQEYDPGSCSAGVV